MPGFSAIQPFSDNFLLAPLETQSISVFFKSTKHYQKLTCEINLVFVRYLPPANEVWGKVMFLHMSVILFTGGWVSAHCMLRHTPPWADTPPPGYYGIQSTSGWYASYWNAYLLIFFKTFIRIYPNAVYVNGIGSANLLALRLIALLIALYVDLESTVNNTALSDEQLATASCQACLFLLNL